MSGYEVVFDLYPNQMSVSAYRGKGVKSGVGVGGSVSYSESIAIGFHHSVSDWHGYFSSASVSAGVPLPWISHLANVNVGYVQSAIDSNQNGRIEPREMLPPSQGIYGGSIGVSLGANVLPSLPITATVYEGFWRSHKGAIHIYYDLVKRVRLGKAQLTARLIDADHGQICSEDWPNTDGHRDCFIEFGHPNKRYTKSSFHQAVAICHINGACLSPLSGPSALGTIALGALRDAGSDLNGLCPAMEMQPQDREIGK